MTVMSGRCVPPRYGSLSTHDTPSRWSSPTTAATAAGIAPRCTGMCSACMTISPRGSNSAVEQSRRSLMFAEWALRTSAAPISSHAAFRAPVTTCSSTGSSTAEHHAVAGLLAVPSIGHEQRQLRVVGAQLDARTGLDARHAQRHELDVRRVVAVPVALGVQRRERLAQLIGGPHFADGQLVRLPAVAHVAGHLDAGPAFGACSATRPQFLDRGV